MLKPYVTATPPLQATEWAVAQAYLVLFGRSPERAGLAHWAGVLGPGATLAQAVDHLLGAVDGSRVLDATPSSLVAKAFHGLLGQVAAEDPAAQAHWTGLVVDGALSFGQAAQDILAANQGATGYAADTLRHRLETLESICRLQAAHGRDLDLQDARVAVLRCTGDAASYESAMADAHRLLVLGMPSVPNRWDQALTAASFHAQSRVPANGTVRQHRGLVWTNRAGRMLLATAWLPPNFQAASQHRGIIALHGGGWRQGYPEMLDAYASALAAGADPSYVVLAPGYRLTAFGAAAPAQEEDVRDFWDLVRGASSGFLQLAAGRVGLFGESSGGHLACLVGAGTNAHRVLALYPPIDLRSPISPGLDPYTGFYAPSAAQKAAASPNAVWTPARSTRFQLWHGNGDPLVPPAQSALFDAAVGANCATRFRDGEGHGFSPALRAEVVAAARVFFDERQPVAP